LGVAIVAVFSEALAFPSSFLVLQHKTNFEKPSEEFDELFPGLISPAPQGLLILNQKSSMCIQREQMKYPHTQFASQLRFKNSLPSTRNCFPLQICTLRKCNLKGVNLISAPVLKMKASSGEPNQA
jgi:hypothetical protein